MSEMAIGSLTIRRLDAGFCDWKGLLALIGASFAYMHGRIDPPSSATALSAASLQQKALTEIGFVACSDDMLVGCVFCRPEVACLYIGKLAVLPGQQGKGIGRQLLATAEDIARQMRLPALRLETRIELVENHATFATWGFAKTAEHAHPGFARTTFIEMRKHLTP